MEVSKKVYYKIKFTLSSPLALSSGENNYADRDVIRDASGKPFIPASSIAGVCRNALKAQYRDSYLGYVQKADESNSETAAGDSMIMFYDALMEKKQNDPKNPNQEHTEKQDQEYKISIRDGVGLDEYKTAKRGAKYDMEVLEPGVVFVTYIEQNLTDSKSVNVANIVADLFNSNKLCFGGKTTRGYGDILASEIKQKRFDLTEPEKTKEWISFDMYGDATEWDDYDYTEAQEKQTETETVITLSLKQREGSGISIRKNSSKPSEKIDLPNGNFKKIPEPDYEQLTLSGDEPIPVIPGTSWAGAFGHQMKNLGLNDSDYKDLFGYVKGKETKKSRIRFSETQLKGSTSKKISRTAIDRFSGAVVTEALFTERTYYHGYTEEPLRITINGKLNSNQKGALSAAIADLGYGFMAVGGLTAIGRGLFTIERINGKEVMEDEVFETVKEFLSASGGEHK